MIENTKKKKKERKLKRNVKNKNLEKKLFLSPFEFLQETVRDPERKMIDTSNE